MQSPRARADIRRTEPQTASCTRSPHASRPALCPGGFRLWVDRHFLLRERRLSYWELGASLQTVCAPKLGPEVLLRELCSVHTAAGTAWLHNADAGRLGARTRSIRPTQTRDCRIAGDVWRSLARHRLYLIGTEFLGRVPSQSHGKWSSGALPRSRHRIAWRQCPDRQAAQCFSTLAPEA